MIGTGFFRGNNRCRRIKAAGEMKHRGAYVQRWRCMVDHYWGQKNAGRNHKHLSKLETMGLHQLSRAKGRERSKGGPGQKPGKHQYASKINHQQKTSHCT